jgi:hypothetical protein
VRVRTDLSLAAVVLLAGCGKPTEVELRLFPCGTPARVDVDVQGYDADGGKLAPALHASFAIADSGVFGDGYATVGLRKQVGMVTADFTLTWQDADGLAEVVTHSGLAVPAAGEVLELGASECMPVGETSTGTSAGTSTGTSTGSGSSSSSSSSGSSSTSTGDTTTGSSSTTTMDESTGTSTTTGSTGDSSTTEDEESLLGDPCAPEGAFGCDQGGPGQVGSMIKCVDGFWEPLVAGMCDVATFCKPNIGFEGQPVAIGCSGIGTAFSCLCQDTPAADCPPEIDDPCGDPDDTVVKLCIDGKYTLGQCAVCTAEVDGPWCSM